VRAGVDQSVTVRWSAAEVAALFADLYGLRRRRSQPVAQDFTLGLMPEHQQQGVMFRPGQVDGSASLWRPYRYPGRRERGDHHVGLAAGECPLELSPTTSASKLRSRHSAAVSSAAACGRRVHGRLREVPVSKKSATIRPCPAITRPAASTCHAHDDAES
jgi:hypothetical protein